MLQLQNVQEKTNFRILLTQTNYIIKDPCYKVQIV